MLRALVVLSLAASLLAGCGSIRNCVPHAQDDPDYASPAAWACRPDVDGDACDIDLTAVEVLADGSTQLVPHAPAVDPQVDCFFVYPTVDLSLRAGLHQDLADHDEPFRSAGVQVARFSEVCRVFAPLYRQVTLGTYSARERVQEACFDAAYDDVLRAFERYVEHDNQGRDFVLIGHSQGAQIVSRLLRERVESDAALHGRMLAALPIGWTIGTDDGGSVGGSFQSTPVCTTAEQLGCVVSHRSYAAENAFPTFQAGLEEGTQGVCVHPGDVAGGGPAPLSRTYLPADLGDNGQHPPGVAEQADFVLYRDLYSARCVHEGGAAALEVSLLAAGGDARTNPLDFTAPILAGKAGTHNYDVHMTLGDLIDLVAAKIAARGLVP